MRTLLAVAICVAAPLQAQHAPEVRGRVIDAPSGRGLADADVRLETGERAVADADGRFVLRAATPGERTLLVRRPGHAPRTLRLRLENGRTLPVLVALDPLPVQLDEQRTIARTALGPDATVLDRAAIAARGARDLADALDGLAGVVVTRRGGPGSPATVSIRGSSDDHVLVLVDGLPRSSLSGEADLSTIPADVIDSIVVLRGARSATYGPQALAGVVLVTTRTAERRRLDLQAGAGQFGGLDGQARVQTRTRGGLGLLVGADWLRQPNRFDVRLPDVRGGGRDVRRNADVERLQLNAAADGAAWRLRADVATLERGLPGSIVAPTPAGRQQDRRWSLQGAAQARAGAWRLDLDGTVQRQRTAWGDSLPPNGPAYADTARLLTLQARTAAARDYGALRVRAALEARLLDLDATQLAADRPGTLRFLGAAASAVHRLADGLEATLEARADGGTTLDGLAVSPRAVLQARRGRVGAALSWGRGIALPSAADLFVQDGVRVRANPSLRPERVRGDLALALDVRDIAAGPLRLEAGASVYRADVDGMVLWSPDFRFIWSPFNQDIRRRGADAVLRIATANGRAALLLQGAHADVTYRSDVLDGQVIYRPRWTANARLDVRAAEADLSAEWRWTGARRTAPGSSLNLLPAFALTDLRAARDLGRTGLRARLGLENVFDVRSAMLPDFPLPGRTWTIGIALALPGTAARP